MENGYLYVFVCFSAVAFASFVIYDSERLNQARFALGIILLSALCVPLGSLVGTLRNMEFDYTGGDYSSDLVEKTLEEAYCEGILRSLCTQFSVAEENVTVEAEGFDPEKMKAETVRVTLSGRGALVNLSALREHVEGLGVKKCITEVRIG